MAIKGKKKSQSRGSQGVRRPAQAPRPVVAPRRGRTPFYRTRDGILLLSIFGLVAVGVIIWLIMSARNDAAELQKRADALDDYTNQVRSFVQTISGPATEMTELEPIVSEEMTKTLEEDSDRWVKSLQEGRVQLGAVVPPEGAESLHQLFEQSLQAYISAAQTFAIVPQTDQTNLQNLILVRGADQRDVASNLSASAIGILDDERGEVELGVSGVQPPARAQPPPVNPEELLPTPPAGGGGQGGGGKDE